MKHSVLTALLITATHFLYAQTDVDALRYSSVMFNGSARSLGIGGAITGLGGDISSLSVNPAGIARIGISEFTITAGLESSKSDAAYLGGSLKDNQLRTTINNAGFIYAPKKKVKSLNGFTIGFSFNRLANFNDKFYLKGTNNENSLSYNYSDKLNQSGVDSSGAANLFPFDASLAYLGEIIRRTSDNEYFSVVNVPVEQQILLNRKGGMNDFSLGVGIETKRNLMLGLSIGIPTINYKEDVFLKETDNTGNSEDFNYWQRQDLLKTEGAGINAKFGLLYNPTSFLRIGASFTTPTLFSLTDTYTTYFQSDFTQFTIDNFDEPLEGTFEYKLKTPWRLNVGASFIKTEWGLVSVEYEMSDPSNAKFKFKETDPDIQDLQNTLNQTIQNKYTATHTIKVGIEAKIKAYRVRGGLQYRTSPFENQEAFGDLSPNTFLTYSAGLGYRGNKFFIDGTFFQSFNKEVFVPYSSNYGNSPTGQISYNRPGVSMTLGFKF
jgi:long-subunit fatty acid transport protein